MLGIWFGTCELDSITLDFFFVVRGSIFHNIEIGGAGVLSEDWPRESYFPLANSIPSTVSKKIIAYPWISKGIHGNPWISNGIQRCSQVSVGIHGKSWATHAHATPQGHGLRILVSGAQSPGLRNRRELLSFS